jgi:Acetyltransferase (GNAT) domain
MPFVGIGGVFVSAPFRGQGLGSRIVGEALRRAATLGPVVVLLFCHRDRVGLYERHGFVEVDLPVFVQQPRGFVEVPLVAMWLRSVSACRFHPGESRSIASRSESGWRTPAAGVRMAARSLTSHSPALAGATSFRANGGATGRRSDAPDAQRRPSDEIRLPQRT